MKVAVVSNLDERCGNGEYARNLASELTRRFTVDLMSDFPSGQDHAVVIVNYHPPVVHFGTDTIQRMRGNGAKVILIMQESEQNMCIDSNSTFCHVDAVVAHEPMNITGAPVNFHFIPHGAPKLKVKPEVVHPTVGTAGFSFRCKRMDIAIRAALRIGGTANIITPSHPTFDPTPMWNEWRSLAGAALQFSEEWLPDFEVARRLATNTMNVYFADEGNAPGQSGSARLMASAKRPLILRRCRKTSALFDYEDELYFVNQENEVYDTASHIWNEINAGRPVKKPKRLMDDIGWDSVGLRYCELVEATVSLMEAA